MARIPEDELERIKRETDLVALVQAAGVELRRHGANVIGRCPFHDDQGPSLVVTPAKHLWHCLGACQAGGSAIDWVMRTDRVSFRHAVELLRVRLGGGTSTSAAPAVSLAPLAVKTSEAEAIDDAALVREVLDFYHETLKASPEAIDYLEQRGLNSVALIDRPGPRGHPGGRRRHRAPLLPARRDPERARPRRAVRALRPVLHECRGERAGSSVDDVGERHRVHGEGDTGRVRAGAQVRRCAGAQVRGGEDGDDVDAPATGFVWTDALRRGLAIRNYGEDVNPDSVAAGGTHLAHVRWVPYRDGLAGNTDSTYPGFDLRIPDQQRAEEWTRELAVNVQRGAMPALEIVYLPRDHTAGTRPGWCTPRACVADNDHAVGRVVDALSHSPFWKNTLVLIVEDDAQAGPDHVDSHRSVMLAISAYSKAGTVSRFVNTTDVLATAESVLGLAPLSQFDHFGHPLADWSATPDLRPSDAIQPTQSITDRNPARGVGAVESRHIDLGKADRVDDAQFNRLLWLVLKGDRVPFPAVRRGAMLDRARER